MLSNPHDYLSKLRWICEIEPTSVYDVGVGFGSFGVMIRERREMPYLRWKQESWEGTLCGCEIFEPYVTEFQHLEYIYDTIDIGPFEKIIDDKNTSFNLNFDGMWDVIHCGDVIEHMTREDGERVLKEIPKHCKNFILSIPIGDLYLDIGDHENDKLNHLSIWEIEDFPKWNKAIGNRGNAGQINTYWWRY